MKYTLITLVTLATFTASCAQKKAEPEKYYIPKDFRGKVLIVFGIDDGLKQNYDKSFRVYSIQKNGTLLTQFTSNEGYTVDKDSLIKFYLIDQKDTIDVPVLYEPLSSEKEPKDSLVYIFEIHDGNFGNHHYKSFFIDTLENAKNYPESAFTEDSQKLEELYKQNHIN